MLMSQSWAAVCGFRIEGLGLEFRVDFNFYSPGLESCCLSGFTSKSSKKYLGFSERGFRDPSAREAAGCPISFTGHALKCS